MLQPNSLIHLRLVAFLVLTTCSAHATLKNSTFDDTDPNFTYKGTWHAINPSDTCNACATKPDIARTYGGTHHNGACAADMTSSGSFTFTGSAVYIFGIDQTRTSTQPNIVFTVEGTRAVHRYTGAEPFVYDALFFAAEGLAADKTHTVNWVFDFEASSAAGNINQVALFDYAIVTEQTEDGPKGSGDGTQGNGGDGGADKGETGTGGVGSSANQDSNKLNSGGGQSSSAYDQYTAGGFKESQNISGSQSTSVASNPSQTSSSTNKNPHGISISNGTSESTVPDTSSPAQSPPAGASTIHSDRFNIGLIIGAVVAAICTPVLVAIFYMVWRRKSRARSLLNAVYPFNAPGISGPSVANSIPTTPVDSEVSSFSASHRSEKMLMKWNNNYGAASTEVLLLRDEPLKTPSVGTTTTIREQVLEQRLADLEARIAVQLPPAYGSH
ncbi:hypothetical protein C8J57DRAFT_412747 [Mycena rebaudengoi]|nr:hypothetical protein C8J57DRAFT_412747 [Mycena rebaudengoi]